MSLLLALYTVFCLLPLPTVDAKETWQPSRQPLTLGIETLTLPGTVGSLCVFGREAFPVITGSLSDEIRLPVIACAQAKRGRVVACGHGGYVDHDHGDSDTSKLMLRLCHWAAGHDIGKTEKPLKVAFLKQKGLAKLLAREGHSVATLKIQQLGKQAKFFDVLVMSGTDMRSQDVPLVQRYLARGGGLVYADAAWVWESYRKQRGQVLSRDNPPSQLFSPYGIVWTGATVGRDAASGIAVQVTLREEVHALSAVYRLAQEKELTDAEVKQAMSVLAQGLEAIPGADKLLLPYIDALAKRIGTPELLSLLSSRSGVVEPTARLAIARMASAAQQVKPEATSPSELAVHFPGSVPSDAERVSKSVRVDLSVPCWHCSGLYAPPGETLTVRVPVKMVQAGLSVRIGCHSDKLWHKKSWHRPPQIDRVFAIESASVKIGNAFGGMIYLEVPGDKKKGANVNGAALNGTLTIKIEGAVRAPVFRSGETSLADWTKTIREYPAPWAEIGSDKIIFTVPASSVRQLDQPDDVMDYWDSVMDTCAELAMIDAKRVSPERFVIDTQISAGFMHAGYPIMAPTSMAAKVLDVARLRAEGDWGVFHEIGHNHQQPEWTFDGMGEVTVNLFSMYCYDKLHAGIAQHPEVAPEKIAARRTEYDKSHRLDGPWENLDPYIELKQKFGWEPYRKVFAEYARLSDAQRPTNDLEKRNQWLRRFSRVVGRNLTDFFVYWGIETSDEARASVKSLPIWTYP